MEGRQAVFQTFRNRLKDSATLTAIVVSTSIRVSGRPPTTYPAIRLRVVGGTGRNFPSFLSGDVYLNIYTAHRSPSGRLASIFNIVSALLKDKATAMTTDYIGFGRITEDYVDYPIYEEDVDKFYLASRYGFVCQIKD